MELIYKYYGFEAGLAALKNRSLGFNKPTEFNDPMEGRLWLHQNGLTPDYLDFYLDAFGVLCMTKNPLNPLMWAHYGQSHKGFVVGYDLKDPIFGDQIDNLFNASSGKVFFTPEYEINDIKSASLNALQLAAMPFDEPFTEEVRQILRHIFLMKQDCWSYEEEVRIVKLTSNFSQTAREWVDRTGNNFKSISTLIAPKVGLVSNPIQLLQIPEKSIKRVILGVKNPLLCAQSEIQPDPDLADFLTTAKMKVEQVKWDNHGKMLAAAVGNNICWGSLKKIQTHSLSAAQLRAISAKLQLGHFVDQRLTVTQDDNGSAKAYWENELE